MVAAPTPTLTVDRWAERFLASRIDIDPNTTRNYRTALKKVGETFGDRDPQTITVDEVAEWVATLAETMKPGTIQLYVIAFRLLLDYCNVDPNPARDPRVKLPKRVREEPNPPPADHVIAILGEIHDPLRRLLFVTLEQGALRLGEAVSLTWGDVDRAGLRLRLPRSATKRDKARWVYLPEWLIEAIEETCPLEDRTPDRRVFQGITEATAYQTMLRACQTAGTPALPPARPPPSPDHDLASVGGAGAGAGGAGRTLAAVDEPRRLLARDARRRSRRWRCSSPYSTRGGRRDL